jgi:hypothetical protein
MLSKINASNDENKKRVRDDRPDPSHDRSANMKGT